MPRPRDRRVVAIRPLEPEDFPALPPLLVGRLDVRRQRARELEAASHIDPLHVIGAFVGGELVAVAQGGFLALGYNVADVYTRDPRTTTRPVDHLLRWLTGRFAGTRVDALVGLEPARQWLRSAFERAGFERRPEMIRYRRDLRGLRASRVDPFGYRTFDEVGRPAVTGLLEAIRRGDERDPSGLDTHELMETMLFAEGADRDSKATELWHIPCLDGKPAGVALAHIDPGRPDVGTLLYIGLLPEHRGKGLGRVLHAHALSVIKRSGARVYEDMTGAENYAMRRIFERNRCESFESACVYLHRPPAPPSRFSGLRGLVDYVVKCGYEHTVDSDSHRLVLRVRAADQEAIDEVAWPRNATAIEVVCPCEVEVAPSDLEELGQVLSSVDAALELPGLMVDVSTKRVRYRATLLTGRDGSIAADALLRVLRSAVLAKARFRAEYQPYMSEAHPRAGHSLLHVPVLGS